MIWIDQKYCSLLSSRLQQYQVKRDSPFQAIFRCPLCGDSQRKSTKRRGQIYAKDNSLKFHCFNCGEHHAFSYFLKLVDPDLHREYALEAYHEDDQKKVYYDENPNNDFKKPVFITTTALRHIKKISSLKADHPAKIYISKRLIPNPYHARLFYCSAFFRWTNMSIPDKFDVEGSYDQQRIIIPLLDKELTMFGYQGRAFDSAIEPKYYTIMLDPDKPKIFGLDTIDFSAPKVYILEGPFDSMFVSNSIAMVGADLSFKGVEPFDLDKAVFIYDNEPRNPEMIKRTKRVIAMGWNVVVWPSGFEYKDINDMIMAGMDKTQVKQLIDDNTYRSLAAMNAFNAWRRD